MNQATQPLISAMRVDKLFGLYTYSLPRAGSFQNAAILYGDNGVGKSTILRMAFHLLSAAKDRGHRNALFKIDFHSFEIALVSGVTIKAERVTKSEIDFLQLTILRGEKILARWDYRPGGSRSIARAIESDQYVFFPDGERLVHSNLDRMVHIEKKQKGQSYYPSDENSFLETLKNHVPIVFILNADRRLDSDSVPDPSDEIELRKVMRYEDAKHLNDLVARSREIALSQAMSTASSWVSKKALQGANQASMNVHSVYIDVLRHVIKQSQERVRADDTRVHSASLLARLKQIEVVTTEFARYELATELSITELTKALKARSPRSSDLAAELLEPYIASLEGRLRAVQPVYDTIDRFVSIINKFLSDKSLTYKLTQGFKIQNKLDAILSPSQLSSGEQQLLLLFYYVLTGRDNPSIFIIDEPEISLNIKWQRQLVQSLLDVTEQASIQFIFASHSMELLAQHRGRVVKLDEVK